MKTFTIDSDNNISAFPTLEEAAAAITTPFESFTSQKELAALAAKWPEERLVAIWNSLAGGEAGEELQECKGRQIQSRCTIDECIANDFFFVG